MCPVIHQPPKPSSPQVHRTMAAIKGKNTKPEMMVRRFLWSRGFRYRVNNPRLPGHPDIVLRKYMVKSEQYHPLGDGKNPFTGGQK